MHDIISMKNCKNLKSSEEYNMILMQLKPMEPDCSNCVYFSGRNCLMEGSKHKNLN